jgi:hypothetical protein
VGHAQSDHLNLTGGRIALMPSFGAHEKEGSISPEVVAEQ